MSVSVKSICTNGESSQKVICNLLNSGIFYLWFVIMSDCRDLNIREINNFPLDLQMLNERNSKKLSQLNDNLMSDYKANKMTKRTFYKATGHVEYDEYYPKLSKPIIDEIDKVLAVHYGFTDEELDFIINYDIKYRMGDELNSEE